MPLPDVYHVATFYNCFSLEPVGRNLVQVCLGTACHVRGAPKVLDRVLTDLKLPAPGTSADMEFTVRTVRCIGCCGLAPVVRVNDNTHPSHDPGEGERHAEEVLQQAGGQGRSSALAARTSRCQG